MPTDIFPITATLDDGRIQPFTTGACHTGKHSAAVYESFFRFTNVTIPRGAIISNAKLLFVADITYLNVVVNTRIQAEHANNPPAITSYANYLTRVKTTEFRDWDAIPGWTVGQPYESPDIANVISDVIEEAWWDSGDALQVFWLEHGSTAASLRLRRPAGYESARTEPRLEITWMEPEGSAELPGKFVVRHMGAPVDLFSKFEIPTTFSFSGITKDRDGNRLGNCEVALFRTIAGNPPTYLFIESGMSDGNGDYSFTNLIKTKYFVRGQKDGSPNVFDTTDNETSV